MVEKSPTTLEHVQRLVAENLGIDADEVTLDSTLDNDLGADSLDVVEISMALEEFFAVEIDDDEMNSMVNIPVRDIVAVVDAKLAHKNKKGSL